ncbi:alpha-galactosidase [Streptomyces sp. N2-109]|uniref:Alpha-galactosidase n=1 Tax=Streptomyces gossypii TaxID=2883101 RepID=A0ABT2JYW8_9ACTN|nr:alpha-galactosidase [Streptomyces gossypii]MCT2592863.1 alpha-galactosidase [Streptomyces gossypii]
MSAAAAMPDRWGAGDLALHFLSTADGQVLLSGLARTAGGEPTGDARAALPLVEIALAGEGSSGTSGKRHVDGALGRRLRYVRHAAGPEELVVELADPETGLRVAAHYTRSPGLPVLRSWAELTAGEHAVTVERVSSFVFGGLAGLLGAPSAWERELYVWSARNPWSGEYRFSGTPLGELGVPDVGMARYGQTGTKSRAALTSTGSWPSSEWLPMGWVEGPESFLAWQIEHNGSWHAELGDRYDDVYLLLSGPASREHQWSVRLEPGESFRTVTASVALAADRDAALAALTRHRRAARRRSHPDHDKLPVVFNDFMNCLMGDPTTERLLPLVSAAAEVGAEVFCVDAGWYDTERGGDAGPGGVPGWWDAVGAWEPAASRFPGGLAEVTDAVKAAGMVPGLWLEPEVVGVRSPVAGELPAEAFFRRDGQRVVEWGRYQLDLRHPAAVAHLDSVVDRLVGEFGLGYLKLDYNIDIGAGTDTDSAPHGPGHGLLGHNRAYLNWLDGVLDRHPGLTIEGCAAGGMRTDHATLAHVSLQSLTDQQDPLLLPPIAAAAPAAVPPEQGAMWAYPQAGQSAEETAFCMVTAMLGRVHLSGRLDLLDARQRGLVAEALAVYREFRGLLPRAVPSWPLGLPGWRDGWLALALEVPGTMLLALWRREGAAAECELSLPRGAVEVTPLYPLFGEGELGWERGGGALRVRLGGAAAAARLLRIRTG